MWNFVFLQILFSFQCHHRVHEKNISKNDPTFLADILQNLQQSEAQQNEVQQATELEFKGEEIDTFGLKQEVADDEVDTIITPDEIDSSLPIMQISWEIVSAVRWFWFIVVPSELLDSKLKFHVFILFIVLETYYL